MRLGAIHSGDIVECDIRGDVFVALVDQGAGGRLVAKPINNGRGSVRIVTARQVRAHWRRAGRGRGGGDDAS